ncbi:MAG: hypothetical protein IJ613_11115 [Muribaculaceae bacterium]|nr:hypothetical protein [Muribaculaceae bacterium]
MDKLKQLLTVMAVMAAAVAGAAQLSPDERTMTQNFDQMWDGTSATLVMPDDWRVDRQMNAPRTVGSWQTAQTTLMYEGGVSLASNAKNGTWNFGASATPADRAVGGLSTTVSGGTRCVSVMTHLSNAAQVAIEKLTLGYDIEKYRYGSNPEGFAVQVYYSTDGIEWTSAGDDLRTYFSPDQSTIGAEVVPISTTAVSDKAIKLNVPAGGDLYLAWNISVAAGTSPNLAMGLALDNVSVTATFAGEENLCTIYAEDVTRWPTLLLNAGGQELSPAGSATVNGVAYKYFELPGDGSTLPLTFNNGSTTTVVGPTITADRDYYLCVTANGVTVIDDPATYSGWVDPDRPPFVASGIYLRGEVNSWGASADWQFSDEGNGIYVLYDKQLSGQFKVADASWSSACNYGSNGTSVQIDTPYSLVSGTNDNISCGGNTYICSRIVLTIVDGQATLLLESDDDPSGLTAVYLMGDHNGWNYVDTSGALNLTDQPGVFAGQVTLTPGDDGTSRWRIYQRLGMAGVWGNPGGDATQTTLQGSLEKGSRGTVAAEPGTYQVTFDINTGHYTLEQIASQPVSMELRPAEVTLVPQLPERVRVLSLNNSLIHYNDQDQMFNDIAQEMGTEAQWTRHSLLGKSLNAHWAEGDGLAEDGNPGAKMLVRSQPWSHIILQEQSSLPRTEIETFRTNVKQWVDYIRDYCPNPNAVIIVPVNWAYSGDWENYTAFNKVFVDNCLELARDLGVTLCPVGVAYQDVYDREGPEGTLSWFQDDRHPTIKATYMAAAMEYGLIYGMDPATITGTPDGMTATEAQQMRDYASRALMSFDNVVDHTAATVRYSVVLRDQFGMAMPSETPYVATLSGGGTVDDNFVYTADRTPGDYTLDVSNGTFAQQALIHVAQPVTEMVVLPAIELNADDLAFTENFDSMGTEAAATLPAAWRIDRILTAPRTVGRYDQADEVTMYAGGANLPSNAKNGTWNFGADDETDRAPGGISTGVAGGTRCVNVYAHLLNTGRKSIQDIQLAYDVEKYRMGNNAEGFDVQLYYSIDGRNWTSAGDDFKTHFDADAQTAGYASVPGDVVHVSATLPTVMQAGCDLYLAWNISVADGTAAQGAMALAIDNVAFSGQLPPIPTARHYIYANDLTGWDALGLYAWGDGELFGAWPGETWVDQVDIAGVSYKKFLLDTDSGNYHLIFNNWNNGQQTPDYDIVADRDHYFDVYADHVVEVSPQVGVSDISHSQPIDVRGGVVVAKGIIRVYDLMGCRVAMGTDCLNIADLPHGIYLIHTDAGVVKVAK